MTASSGATAGESAPSSSVQRARSHRSSGSSAHARRAPTIPVRTPPSTPLARPADSVSATKAAGSADQPLPVSRASTTYVVTPGRR